MLKAIFSSGLLSWALIGCSTVQLSQIQQNRTGYEQALVASDNEQFLLNLVRLQANEAPFFVNVDSLTAATTLTAAAALEGGVDNPYATENSFALKASPQLSFSQSPTISYSVVQGNTYVKGLLAPLSLTKLYLLVQSGFTLDEVFNFALERVATWSNPTNHFSLNYPSPPANQQFTKVGEQLQQLWANNQIDLQLTEYESQPAWLINPLTPTANVSLTQIFQTKPANQQFILAEVAPASQLPTGVIAIKPRSLFNILLAFARANTSPAGTITADNNSAVWIKIKQSSSQPSQAAIKVKYNDNWYYIASQDQASLTNLAFLKLVYAMQVGEVAQTNLPVITIPVK